MFLYFVELVIFKGENFYCLIKKSINLCGCKSYLFYVNNYMLSINVLLVLGDRYMNKRYLKWILSFY